MEAIAQLGQECEHSAVTEALDLVESKPRTAVASGGACRVKKSPDLGLRLGQIETRNLWDIRFQQGTYSCARIPVKSVEGKPSSCSRRQHGCCELGLDIYQPYISDTWDLMGDQIAMKIAKLFKNGDS